MGVFLCVRKYLLVLHWIGEIYQSSKLLFWLNIAKVFPLCFYPKNYFEMIILRVLLGKGFLRIKQLSIG